MAHFSVAIALIMATSASAIDVVGIGTDQSIDNGIVITARVAGNTLQTLGVTGGNNGDIADLGWQSDRQLALLTVDAASGQFGLINSDASTAVPNNGLGEPGSTLSVYSAGPCLDCIFYGTVDTQPGISNTQVRVPALAPIASAGMGGINGGPGQFGDGAIVDSVQQPDGDLIFIYENSPDGAGRRRIRRQLNGDLAAGAGDEGLGVPGGLAVDTQTLVDRLVLGRQDDIIELRNGATLSPDLGGFSATAGPFAGSLVDIGVLSNDDVVVAAGNELLVRAAADLSPVANSGLIAGATGTITALAVNPVTDRIFIGTDEGNVRVFDRNLVEIVPLTNYGSGTITALAVTIPEPASVVLMLMAVVGLLSRRR